jgi:GNAT superfamily N-acetyltransferase
MGYRIRLSLPEEFAVLEEVERAADVLFLERFRPETWPPTESRAADPGFVLVAANGGPIGFAHVLEADGIAHLEQVSVLPEHGGRGIGGVLVATEERLGLDRYGARVQMGVSLGSGE